MAFGFGDGALNIYFSNEVPLRAGEYVKPYYSVIHEPYLAVMFKGLFSNIAVFYKKGKKKIKALVGMGIEE